jgi:hypothetical protein
MRVIHLLWSVRTSGALTRKSTLDTLILTVRQVGDSCHVSYQPAALMPALTGWARQSRPADRPSQPCLFETQPVTGDLAGEVAEQDYRQSHHHEPEWRRDYGKDEHVSAQKKIELIEYRPAGSGLNACASLEKDLTESPMPAPSPISRPGTIGWLE